MFSKYGRITTVDLSVTKLSDTQWLHVSIFRTSKPNDALNSNPVLSTSRTGPITKSTIARLRRAQDRLMEGKP